ncbi:hypothetical protein Tcan_01681, partial [Toxocara canis]
TLKAVYWFCTATNNNIQMRNNHPTTKRLSDNLKAHRTQQLRRVALRLHKVCLSRNGNTHLTRNRNPFTSLLSVLLFRFIFLYSIQKILPTLRRFYVLHPHIYVLRNYAIADNRPHTFVDDDSDRVFSYVENASRPSVVSLKGHTLLECTVAFDVDNITTSVGAIERREGLNSVLTERTTEHITRTAPYTLWIHHSLL